MARPWPPLSVLGHLIALLVVQVNTSENDILPLVRKHFVYGSSNQKVMIYVKMLKDSPFLACMDLDTAEKETIDPVFMWIGPNGMSLIRHSNMNLTQTGKLMLKTFDTSMSGSYSCTLSYKSVNSDITKEKETFMSYEFVVLAYHDPDYVYQIDLRYMAKPCNDLINDRFVLTLLEIVKEVITGLNCDLKNMFHKCHFIKSPKHSLRNELFISFKVSPFTSGWDKQCSRNPHDCQQETNLRLEKARNLIVEFFKIQIRVLEEEFVNTPEIYYMEHSLDIIRVDSCRPGFGKNKVTHHDCLGCCVSVLYSA
ncbi:zona pellucida-binding protein 2 isoform X2 [Phyllobates terribilis]|uniref:zona pellucida-binding protein 2 isoform X2 n=1 Tax=Phyllobates terribilis TaxID=111132 RepID=UPI003CCA74D6